MKIYYINKCIKMLSSFKVPEKISHIIRLYNICFFTKEAWEKKKKKLDTTLMFLCLEKHFINGKKINQKKSTSLDLILRLEIL